MPCEVVKSLLHSASYDQIAILFDGGQLSTPYLIHEAIRRARSHVISGFRPDRQNARSIAALNKIAKGLRKTPDLCINVAELATYLAHFKAPRPESILSSVITRCRKLGRALEELHDQEVIDYADSITLAESSPMEEEAPAMPEACSNTPAEHPPSSSVVAAEGRDNAGLGGDGVAG